MREDPMTYTTYAAPKQSITGGNLRLRGPLRAPRQGAMWEGHLRRYRLGDDGTFPDNIDSNPATTVVERRRNCGTLSSGMSEDPY